MTGVIGLDLSLTSSGVCDFAGNTSLVETTGKKDATLDQRHARLTRILTDIRLAAHPTPTDLVVIEAPSYASGGGSAWDRAGLWWLVVSFFKDSGNPVLIVPPKTAKKYATGNGDAPKESICKELYKRFGVDIDSNDEADAYMMRAVGLALLGRPLADMPAANRAALDKLTLPEGLAA